MGKSAVEDDKVKDKISDDDKKTVVDKCNEVVSWLDANQTAEKDEFDHQQKELEGVCNPIMTKLYQAGVLLEVCPVVCPEECPEELVKHPLLVDPPSRKLINLIYAYPVKIFKVHLYHINN